MQILVQEKSNYKIGVAIRFFKENHLFCCQGQPSNGSGD